MSLSLLGRVVLGLLAVVAIAGQGSLAWAAQWAHDNRQWLSDRAIARQFVPSEELRAYVADAGLSPEGEVYLFASVPEVVPAGEFDRYCSRDEPGIGVLGCYRLAEKRIFLYDVTDDRLEPMEPVIAAHEMLHAAWDRFDERTQNDIATLLEEGFAALPDDHQLRERIASYEDFDPNSRIPELYALMGTEVATLPAALEEHYARFFTDRQRVVSLAERVLAIFETFDSQLQALVDDLNQRSAVIDAAKREYEAAAEVLGAEIRAYNDKVAAYNAGENVAGAENFDEQYDDLTSRQGALRIERGEIQELIDEYNALLDELQILNQELTELNQGINITLEEQETVEATEEVSQN